MSAVEFSLVAVPFFGVLFAIFETGFVFFQGAALQAAVQTAARSILTGVAQGQSATVNTSASFNATFLCPNLPSFISCASLITDVRYLPTAGGTFTGADLANDFYKSGTKFCVGPPAGYVTVVRVAYPMPVFLPILTGPFEPSVMTTGLVNDVPNNPGWKHLLLATAVFETEPYNATSYNPLPGC